MKVSEAGHGNIVRGDDGVVYLVQHVRYGVNGTAIGSDRSLPLDPDMPCVQLIPAPDLLALRAVVDAAMKLVNSHNTGDEAINWATLRYQIDALPAHLKEQPRGH